MECEVLKGQDRIVLYPRSITDHTGLVVCGEAISGEVPCSDMAPGDDGSIKMCREHLELAERLRRSPCIVAIPLHVTVTRGDEKLVDVDWTFTSNAGPELTPAELRRALEDGVMRAMDRKKPQ